MQYTKPLTQRPVKSILCRPTLIGLIGLMGLGLGACASGDEIPPGPCPEILVVADAAKLTRFKPGPGRDIIDVLHEEKITGFAQACEYDVDDSGAGDLIVYVAPTIVSTRGPANQTDNANFEYFVAITDADKKILDKTRYPKVLPYVNGVPRVMWQKPEPHTYVLPLKAGQTGASYLVYLGLQLSREELDYQRKNR